MDAQRDQENRKEPGPWNKPHSKGKLFGKTTSTNDIGFEIHVDDHGMHVDDHLIVPISMTQEESKFRKPLILPPNFCSRNKPQLDWITPVTTEERPDKNTIPQYNKCKLYPRPNVEFQPEEYKAYCVLKRRNIENTFTVKRDIYLARGPNYNLRQYPHFAKQSNPQKRDDVDDFFAPPLVPGVVVAYKEIYNAEEKIERQFEEILALRVKRNETIIKETDMEETICAPSEKIKSRKSFFPMRKSIAPCSARGAVRKLSAIPSTVTEEHDSHLDDGRPTTSCSSSVLPIFENRSVHELPKVLAKVQAPKNEQSQELVTNTINTDNLRKAEERDESIKQMNEKLSSVSKVSFKLAESVESQPPKMSTIVGVVKDLEPFQINQEESFVSQASKVKTADEPMQTDSDFQFKAPAVPSPAINTALQPKSHKIPFDIFEDKTSNSPKPELVCGNGGYFDADETCSTQTFNIFLKAQSVSTPKVKPEPQRLFGHILKQTTASLPPPTHEEEPARTALAPLSDITDENSPATATLCSSPQRKQLSTILETSEHGTTQSTHTTGATTKSTISSPELEQESQAQATANVQHQHTQDAFKKRIAEESAIPNPRECLIFGSQPTDENKNDVNGRSQHTGNAAPNVSNSQPNSTGHVNFTIFEDTIDKTNREVPGNHCSLEKNFDIHVNKQASEVVTPNVARFEAGKGARLDFSIFEDSINKNNNQNVGNFTRLEEKEDTESGYVIKPIRFQEDKTETISKMLLAPPQSVKYQEDKTETITKMLFAPPQIVKFQEDKTETISKMLLAPPPPTRFEDDRTDTITKLMLAPPQPTKLDDELLPKLSIKEKSATETKNQDNFFEFFSQSPPKPAKSAITKPLDKATGLLRTSSECRTPIVLNPKRVCDVDTPDMGQPKTKPTALFSEINTKPKSVLRDSFMLDFSTVEDSQPVRSQQPPKVPKPKSVLRDSFIPDFSLIEDSQPQRPIQQQIAKKITNESFLPDFSHVPETQPHVNDSIIPDSQPISSSSNRSTKQNSVQSAIHSCIPNESMIPDSQPNQNSSSRLKQTYIKTSILQSSYLPDFSIMSNTRTTTNSGEGQPASMKNILTDTFMKDFSEIKEPPPIPMDVKEMTMIQPSKNNSTIKYLQESISQKSNETIAKSTNNNSVKSVTGTIAKLSFLPPNPVKTSMEKKKSGDEKFFELNAETEMFGTNISMIKNSTWLPNHGPMAKNLSQIHEDSIHIKDEQLSSDSSMAKRYPENTASNVSQTMSRQNSAVTDVSKKFAVPELPKPKLSFLNDSNNIVSASRFSIDVSQSEWAAIQAKKQQQQKQQSSQSRQISKEISPDVEDPNDDDFGEMSIYYKHTPKTPKAQVHIWEVPEEDVFKTPANNRYMHTEVDLNQTHHIIENICVDPNVNPFNVDLINAFLEQIQFTTYIQGLTHCMMVRTIQRLKPASKIRINSIEFEVVKLIGEGAYGAVFW